MVRGPRDLGGGAASNLLVLATAGIAFQAFFLRSSRESIGGRAGIMSAAPPYRGPEFRTQMARSEAKTVDSEIAHNENNDDHYANYSEDIHFALLPLYRLVARRARTFYISDAIIFRLRRTGSTRF